MRNKPKVEVLSMRGGLPTLEELQPDQELPHLRLGQLAPTSLGEFSPSSLGQLSPPGLRQFVAGGVLVTPPLGEFTVGGVLETAPALQSTAYRASHVPLIGEVPTQPTLLRKRGRPSFKPFDLPSS